MQGLFIRAEHLHCELKTEALSCKLATCGIFLRILLLLLYNSSACFGSVSRPFGDTHSDGLLRCCDCIYISTFRVGHAPDPFGHSF